MTNEIQQNVLTVGQITSKIKFLLSKNFKEVWIRGEISNFKRQQSGHLYFSLKDAQAQIGAAMFRGHASKLKTLPQDGNEVIVRGEIDVYGPRGNYQIIVRELHFVGMGELLMRLEELKREIAKRGWFSPEHKKPIPPFPKKIGVITSPTGAAVRDILNVLNRRYAGFHFVLNPVRVQGSEAAGEIAQAIRQMNEHQLCDVMIVGRGGGSLEDLWAFNEEVVAQAIFESKIPVIAAVGHESDHCIAEYVADLRAPTPSAAAELVAAEKAQQIEYLEQSRVRLKNALRHGVQHARAQLKRFETHPYFADPYYLLGTYMQRLDGLGQRLALVQPSERIKRERERLERLANHLRSIDPRNLIKKGYSLLFSEEGLVTSVDQLKKDDLVRAQLFDGTKTLRVEE